MQRYLDPHCEMILEEYRDNLPEIKKKAEEINAKLNSMLKDAGLLVAALEYRVKSEDSLAGKLELKGSKYASLEDITDIIGLRVITFYTDDIAKVSSAIERLFEVDWANSVDKRKAHEIDSFGYLSLHYICYAPGFPYRFEIQLRTVLQHAWANMNHDTGYKSGVEIPKSYLRNLSRLAGILELVDEQFSIIRSELTDYRRRVRALVASGNLSEVPLDGDTYRSFLELEPFDTLNKRIAAVNQAEIHPVSLLPYLQVFKLIGCKTLGDLEKVIRDYSDAAYQIASYQIGLTDLDILASSIGPQNLCVAFILKSGGGRAGIRMMFDLLNGESSNNDTMAEILVEQANSLPFMNNK
ncbi:MAG: hypothetical protein IJU68_04525 [Bacteroidales bacterium]|nr:hypothetical protein [Bacteroidales bacterium]